MLPQVWKIIVAALLIIISVPSQGQGCSDAGFCTMGAMKPDQHFNRRITIKLRSLEVAQYVGWTRFGDIVFNYYTDLNIGINERNTLQIKAPFVYVDGALDKTSGLGDLSVSATRVLLNRGRNQVALTIGTKVPLGQTDIKTAEGRSLPMYNQTGLGTWDLIFGVSWISKDWLFATGYQQGFGTTDNSFLWSDWEGHTLEAKALEYSQSNQLVRGKDIMFRQERNFRFTNWNINIGLLQIIRLNQDVIQVPVFDDQDQPVVGETKDKIMDKSEGLAHTLLIGGGYQFNIRSGIKIMNGIRLQRRDKNPDGLSRELVSNIGYVYRF